MELPKLFKHFKTVFKPEELIKDKYASVVDKKFTRSYSVSFIAVSV